LNKSKDPVTICLKINEGWNLISDIWFHSRQTMGVKGVFT
jgi:hypothetical protein